MVWLWSDPAQAEDHAQAQRASLKYFIKGQTPPIYLGGRRLIKDRADNHPDPEGMVAAGRLSYKSGWYEAKNKEAYDAIIQYATSIRVSKDGKAQIKVARQSKRLKALAEKL